MGNSERITEINTKLILNSHYGLQYFGFFNVHVSLECADSKTKTMSIGVNEKAIPICYYNDKFVSSLLDSELTFCLIHECLHMFHYHCQRVTDTMDKYIANLAADMIVNTVIKQDFIDKNPKLKEEGVLTIPKGAYFPPKEYKGELILEDLYMYLKENSDSQSEVNENKEKLKDAMSKAEKEEEENPQETGSQELKKAVMKGIFDSIRNRGLSTSSMERTLGRLDNNRENYISLVLHAISVMKGNLGVGTYRKPNRRGVDELKGKIKYSPFFNVVLDTSNSMSPYFEKILSKICRNNTKFNLIQVDMKVQDFTVVTSPSQLKRIKIKGFGSTVIQKGVDFVSSNFKIKDLPLLILTDGETDNLNLQKIKGSILILTTKVAPKYVGSDKVKVIKIK